MDKMTGDGLNDDDMRAYDTTTTNSSDRWCGFTVFFSSLFSFTHTSFYVC